MNERKRKLLALLLAGLLMAALCGCGEKQPQQDPSPLEDIPSEPVHEGSDVASSPFVGSYRCSWSTLYASGTDDPSWEGRVALLECRADGSFTLTFDSLGDLGMVSVSGSFTVSDDEAACEISARSASGFLGEESGGFTLRLIDENELRYRGEQLGAVADRDIFTREG